MNKALFFPSDIYFILVRWILLYVLCQLSLRTAAPPDVLYNWTAVHFCTRLCTTGPHKSVYIWFIDCFTPGMKYCVFLKIANLFFMQYYLIFVPGYETKWIKTYRNTQRESMTPCALLVECCEMFIDSAWNEHHKIPSSLLVRNFMPAPFLRLSPC